jgi:hypothetical protein
LKFWIEHVLGGSIIKKKPPISGGFSHYPHTSCFFLILDAAIYEFGVNSNVQEAIITRDIWAISLSLILNFKFKRGFLNIKYRT